MKYHFVSLDDTRVLVVQSMAVVCRTEKTQKHGTLSRHKHLALDSVAWCYECMSLHACIGTVC